MREHKHERALSPVDANRDGDGSRLPNASSQVSESEVESEASYNDDDKPQDTFKLTLRSSSTKNITVTVRPTTKCSAIIATFLKRAGKKASGARLVVDGDSMNPGTAIGEADLEDGDMVDVVGL